MSKVDVWMPLYIGDYLADTSRLTTEQHGAYLLLIMDYWRSGPIPDDDVVLAQITRMSPDAWVKSRSVVTSYFTINEGHWVHSRIEKERGKAVDNTEARSKSGTLGAASKWGSTGGDNKLKRSERLANARRLGTHSSGEWEALKQACGNSCLRCGDIAKLVKDHITPIYKGGSDAITNIQPLCQSCNSSKGPDCTDYRPNDWLESLTKCLANACQTPEPSPSPSEVSTSNEVDSVRTTRFVPFSFLTKIHGVDKQAAKDWLALRKVKKLAPTETALNAVVREVEKAGLTMPEVILLCCEKGWGGFNAKWEHELSGNRSKSGNWFMSSSGITAKGAEKGIVQSLGETFPAFKSRVYKAFGVTEEMVRNAQADMQK